MRAVELRAPRALGGGVGTTADSVNTTYSYDDCDDVTNANYENIGSWFYSSNVTYSYFPQANPNGYPTFTPPGGSVPMILLSRFYGMQYDVAGNRTQMSYDVMPYGNPLYEISGTRMGTLPASRAERTERSVSSISAT